MTKHPMRTAFALSLMICGQLLAEEAKQPGLAIGKKAPDFQLKDQHGKPQSLKAMLKKGAVAIVFHRSADW